MATNYIQRYGQVHQVLYDQYIETDPTSLGIPAAGTIYTGSFNKKLWAKDDQGEIIYMGDVIWAGEWTNGTYDKGDMSRDGDWLMIANKTTNERPAPQASGDPYYLYTGTIADPPGVSAKQITFGQRVITGSSGGYLTGWRLNTVVGNHYSVYLISDPYGTPVLNEIISFEADQDGWVNFNIAPVILPAGTIFDYVAICSEPDDVPVTFNGNWNYTTPNNQGTPASGQIIHPNDAVGIMRIHNVDDDGNPWGPELSALTPGDFINGAGQRWAIQSVNSAPATYVEYGVAPAAQGAPDGVGNFIFETVSAVTITVAEDPDANYWASNPNVEGLYIVDGDWSDIVPDEKQYAMDIQIQNAIVSEDWDLLALSGDSGGSAAGWVPYYVFEKTSAFTVTGVYLPGSPPDFGFERVLSLEYSIPGGDTIHEYKISVTYTLNSTTTSAYLRFSTNNGATWNQFQSEPKDITDNRAVYYSYPIETSQGGTTGSFFLLDAAKEIGSDVMIIEFADIIVERVK